MNIMTFALDGADPRLINEWIDEGYLENLEKIRNQGLSGNLKSTFPPLTGAAWPSFHTGVNPGKHGVYGWVDLDNSHKGVPVDGSSIKAKTVWQQISEQGSQVGLVSLPMTYPPEEVDGFVVPGFLTPSEASRRSYPEDLAEKLLEEVPGFEYCSEVYMDRRHEPKSWVEEKKEEIKARGDAARWLFKNKLKAEEDKVMGLHFFVTDMVQHHLLDEVSENWDPRLEIFKAVDREIGKLMEEVPEDTVFLVVSDHGFGPVKRTFNVNPWLKKEGYLSLKETPKVKVKKALAKMGFNEQNTQSLGELIYPIAKELNLADNPIVISSNDALEKIFLSPEDVDWEKTQAFSRSDIGHIRLNLDGQNPYSLSEDSRMLRDAIMKRLERLKVPGTDEKLAEWVKPREDIYSGPYTNKAPEILFNPLEGNSCFGGVVGYGQIMFFQSLEVFSRKIHPGHHRRNGVLMALGPGIQNKEKNASIMDIAPTILNLLSLPIPKQMDGEVIGEITPTEPEFARPTDFYQGSTRKVESINKQEDEEKKEALKNLGYM